MRTLIAKWAGKCEGCGARFEKGATIAWTGRPWHEACHAAETARVKAHDAEVAAEQAAHLAAWKAGERITMRVAGEELIVEGAPTYKMARDEAFAFIASVSLATGKPAGLVVKVKNGKRTIGREIVRYYGFSNIGHREGWAFKYRMGA